MSKRKSKSLRPAASLSSSLLRTGGAARAANAPKPQAKEPPAEPEERPKTAVSKLEPEAFDGLLPGLLKSAAAGPRAGEAPDDPAPSDGPGKAPPTPRLLDQFEFLQSRNQELALKQAGRSDSASLATTFLRNLRAGRFAEAESDFGRIMSLDPAVAKKILHKAEIEDLAVICRAIGFKPMEFATIVALLRGAKGTRSLSAPDQLKASLGIFESIDRDCAMGLLEHIPELPRRDWSSLRRA